MLRAHTRGGSTGDAVHGDDMGGAVRHEGPVAGPHAGAQAAHAGRRGTRQPDGAHRLGR